MGEQPLRSPAVLHAAGVLGGAPTRRYRSERLLSERERRVILALRRLHPEWSLAQLSLVVRRSRSAIHSFLKAAAEDEEAAMRPSGERRVNAVAISARELRRAFVAVLFQNYPQKTLLEAQLRWEQVMPASMSTPSLATLKRDLQFMGFTRKKLEQRAADRCKPHVIRHRHLFLEQMDRDFKAGVRPEQYVYFDETQVNAHNLYRQYGYGLAGQRIPTNTGINRGARHVIFALASPRFGVGGIFVVKNKPVSKETVQSYFEVVLPQLQEQAPDSIVVMDNCTLHKQEELYDLFHKHGIGLRFLPPYHPWFNAVEFVFSALKAQLRALAVRRPPSDMTPLIRAVMASFPKAMIARLQRKCGVYGRRLFE